ncbi:hypothetical protein [Streptomyces sp. NPDC047061]
MSKLLPGQRDEFLDLLGAMALEESNPSRRAFLEEFPDGFGLLEDEG